MPLQDDRFRTTKGNMKINDIMSNTQTRIQLNGKGLEKEGLFASNVRSVQRLDDGDTVPRQQSSSFIAIQNRGQIQVPQVKQFLNV